MVYSPVRVDNPRALTRRLSHRTGGQILLYLTCIIVSSVDLARYQVSRPGHLGICGLWIVQADKSRVDHACYLVSRAGDLGIRVLWTRTGGQILLYLICIFVSSVDLASYQVSRLGDLGICGLSIVQADNPCSISLVSLYPV